MDKSTRTEASAHRHETLGRRRSLLWVLPERIARRLSWLVVILIGVLPLVLIAWAILSHSPDNRQKVLTARLSELLGVPVELRVSALDALGRCRLSGLSVVQDGRLAAVELRDAGGDYFEPHDDTAGRLELDSGRLSLDLDAWTASPAPGIVRLLHNIRESRDLRSVSLSTFRTDLRLAGERVSLTDCVGRAELTEAGGVHGHLTGKTPGGRLGIRFDLTDDTHSVSVRSTPLVWVKKLMTPTLGETLAGLLESPAGEITLGNRLVTGSGAADNWKTDFHTTFDLSRLPEDLGLTGLSGKLDLSIRAWGALGRPATFTARLSLIHGAAATITDSDLARMTVLLTGGSIILPEENRTHTVGAFDLKIIFRREQICLTSEVRDEPVGIFDTAGTELLEFPLGRDIPLGEFLRRLDTLRKLRRDERSS